MKSPTVLQFAATAAAMTADSTVKGTQQTVDANGTPIENQSSPFVAAPTPNMVQMSREELAQMMRSSAALAVEQASMARMAAEEPRMRAGFVSDTVRQQFDSSSDEQESDYLNNDELHSQYARMDDLAKCRSDPQCKLAYEKLVASMAADKRQGKPTTTSHNSGGYMSYKPRTTGSQSKQRKELAEQKKKLEELEASFKAPTSYGRTLTEETAWESTKNMACGLGKGTVKASKYVASYATGGDKAEIEKTCDAMRRRSRDAGAVAVNSIYNDHYAVAEFRSFEAERDFKIFVAAFIYSIDAAHRNKQRRPAKFYRSRDAQGAKELISLLDQLDNAYWNLGAPLLAKDQAADSLWRDTLDLERDDMPETDDAWILLARQIMGDLDGKY